MRHCLISLFFIMCSWTSLPATDQSDNTALAAVLGRTRDLIDANLPDDAASVLLEFLNTESPVEPEPVLLSPVVLELVDLMLASGRYSIAELLLLELVRIQPYAPDTQLDHHGRVYMLLGIARFRLGNYTQASIDFSISIEIFTDLYGQQHSSTVRARNGLAASFFELSRHQEAEELYISLIEDQIALTGEVSQQVATYKHNLAEVLFELDRIEEAEDLLEQALRILGDTVGAANILNARSLILLAKIRSYSGLYVDAEPLLSRALNIQRQEYGSSHPELRYAYNVLAELHFGWGEYVNAVGYWGMALETIGRHHFDAANYLISLGDCYRRLGLISNADDHIQQALEVLDSSHSPHWQVGRALHQQGLLKLAKGRREEAEDLFVRGLSIVEAELIPEHRLYGEMLADLGEFFIREGRLIDAAEVLRRAMRNAIAASGIEGIMTIRPHRLLGRLASHHQDHLECEQHLDSALSTSILYHGIDHLETAACLAEFADYRLSINELDLALEDALRAAEIVLQHHRNAVAALSHDDALAIGHLPNRALETACIVALRQQRGGSIERVWNLLQRSRGLVIDEMMSRRVVVAEARRLDLLDVEQNLSRATAELARYAIQGPGPAASESSIDPNSSARLQHRKHDSEIQKFAAEQRLRDVSTRMRSVLERKRIDLRTVWTMMPSSSAIVSFYSMKIGAAEDSTLSYLAFLKRRDRLDPEILSLGSVEEIDRLVHAWRQSLVKAQRYESEFQTDESMLSRNVRSTGDALRSRIWDPIAARIGEPDLVFLVPDPGLSGVNFAALPIDDSSYLIDKRSIFHYLTSERDLIPAATHFDDNHGLLVVANPDYGATRLTTSRRDASGDGGLLEHLDFCPLPGTWDEALSVIDLWSDPGQAIILSGEIATENAVQRGVADKKVLHFATHGFFIPQDELAPMIDPTHDGVLFRNPLLLSGLALSGANQGESALTGDSDGILTAEEIAIMNLDGCEWVVLSACETGLGVHAGGEGVLGLRRAFQRAGARTVIMSLFKVNDQHTRYFIENLYTERFVNRVHTAEAMQRASRAILNSRREAGWRTIPVDWGDFIAVGDWR